MISNKLAAAAARQIDGPFWIYDASDIRKQIARLKQFDTLRFAQKANSNINILRLMRQEGALVDAVSAGEIERALAAGFQPGTERNEIVFTADVIEPNTIRRVTELGIPVNCGSPDMLEQIGRSSRGHPVWLRINPGFGHGHSRKTNTGGESSKHGIWHENILECIRLVDKFGLKLVGLHMHIGSGADYSHLEQVCEAMVRQVEIIDRPLEAISAGGGLSTPYQPGDSEIDTSKYFDLWHAARQEVEARLKKKIKLEIEPGRFLVARSGALVARIFAVKPVAANHFVILNAGFSDLARPVMYGSYHRVDFVDTEGNDVAMPTARIAVAGPLCEAGDVFTQFEGGTVDFRELPLPSVGDLAIVRDAGAYGASMSSNYNSRPLIPEFLVDGSSVVCIRERQPLADLIRLEQSPRSLVIAATDEISTVKG